MNETLCKKRGRDPIKRKATKRRYMSKIKQFNILLNIERDADIINWINAQNNKQAAIRELIRKNA